MVDFMSGGMNSFTNCVRSIRKVAGRFTGCPSLKCPLAWKSVAGMMRS